MTLFIVAGVVIVFLIFLGLFVAVDLAVLPGKIARKRGHPQADAVAMAGIIGLVTGVLWPLAMAWAYYHPQAGARAPSGGSEENAELMARIAALETQLAQVGTGGGGAPT